MGADEKTATKTSPEVRQFLRAMQGLTRDLPELLQREKRIAFDLCEDVAAYEAHMERIYQVPDRLEEVAKLLEGSFQFGSDTSALSRIFREIYAEKNSDRRARRPERPHVPVNPLTGNVSAPPGNEKRPAGETCFQPALPGSDLENTFPEKVEDELAPDRKSRRDPEHSRIRNALLERLAPGGKVAGRNMFENADTRVVTAIAKGETPWRLKLRKSSLQWASESPGEGVVLLICGRVGHVVVSARDMLDADGRHFHRDSSGNISLRPSVVLTETGAEIHPGAVKASRDGEAVNVSFVEA